MVTWGTEVGAVQGQVKVTEGPGEVGDLELGLAPPTQERPFPRVLSLQTRTKAKVVRDSVCPGWDFAWCELRGTEGSDLGRKVKEEGAG